MNEYRPSQETEKRVGEIIARYPDGHEQAALIPILHEIQREQGYLPPGAVEYAAERLGVPHAEVFGVATFYTMFHLEPPGKFHLQLCMTLPCSLRGADALERVIKEKLGLGPGERTVDGVFSFRKVECLGSCGTAPVVQVNDDYFEGLTPESFAKLLDDLAAGKKVEPSNPRHAL